MPSSPLLIDLAGVARLAGVQRPVASIWRARFHSSADPFPQPAHDKSGRPFFDAMSVAQWLARTDHGNNPTAIADVAAAASPLGFDIAEPAHVASIDAVLTLQAVTDEALADFTPSALQQLAASVDPDDACLATELSGIDPAWIAWAEVLADAAYSPLEASRMLERRHAGTRSSAGSAGPLTPTGEATLSTLAEALSADHAPAILATSGVSAALAHDIVIRIGEVEVAALTDAEGRGIRRRLLLDGMAPAVSVASAAIPRLTVMRLPSAGGRRRTTDMLRAVDELVLGMRDDDRALVLAPAGVLTGALPGGDGLTRADVLRSGRVRAIVRLPAGLVTSAVREPLAVWVLGRETGDVPVGDRFTAVADLTDVSVTTAARLDLASDVLAAMGSARDVRAHAFRFARLVRTTSLLASSGDLLPGIAAPAAAPPTARDLPARLDQARAAMEDDVPATWPTTPPWRSVGAASVDALVADGHVRVVSGTRITPDEHATTGLGVVGADELDSPARIGERRVDPLIFAQRHPAAKLTMPGDVIFRTSPTAGAWVDREGSHVVAHPARVLRINGADPGGLVAELVATDINRSGGGAGSWRRWRLRRVSPLATPRLSAVLTELATRRKALEDRIEALDAYADLLAAGVVAGSVTLIDPAANPE